MPESPTQEPVFSAKKRAFYDPIIKERMERHVIFPEDAEIAEKGASHVDIETITYVAQLERVVDGYLAETGSAASQVAMFVDELPQTKQIREEVYDNEKILAEVSAMHAVAQLRATHTFLLSRLEGEIDIKKAADSYRKDTGGSGTDLRSAAEPSPQDGLDQALRDQEIKDLTRDFEIKRDQASQPDYISEDEVTQSARGEDADEFVGLTPNKCFDIAKKRLFSGIMRSCRQRIAGLQLDLLAGGVMESKEDLQLSDEIAKMADAFTYKGDEGMSDRKL
ncbi:MAG: hypothetical protein O2904_02875 [bacterium]|nr:hypothetical protein [bacterium]